MKNKHLHVYMLLFLNAILLAIAIYAYLANFNSTTKASRTHEANMRRLNYKNQMMWFHLITENTKLNSKTDVINENFDTIPLSDLISRPVIVLRYSELNCQSCVDELIVRFQNTKSLDSANTVLLSWYNNPTHLYQFKRMNRLQYPVFSIKNTGLPPDTLNVPYLFLLDQSLKVSNVFIPEEGDIASLTQFLSFASQKLDKHR